MTNNFKMPFLFNTPIWNQVLRLSADMDKILNIQSSMHQCEVEDVFCQAACECAHFIVPALLLHLIGEYNQTFLVCKLQLKHFD